MMTWLCDFWNQYLVPLGLLLVPFAIIIGSLSLLAAFAIARSTKTTVRSAMAQVSPYAWLGAVCGFIAGASQESLVGALLTGMLGLVSALLSYLSAGKTDDQSAKAIPLAIILLCVGALVGLSIGGSYKKPWDAYREKHDMWKAKLDNIAIPLLKAKQQYEQCKLLMPASSISKCEDQLVGK